VTIRESWRSEPCPQQTQFVTTGCSHAGRCCTAQILMCIFRDAARPGHGNGVRVSPFAPQAVHRRCWRRVSRLASHPTVWRDSRAPAIRRARRRQRTLASSGSSFGESSSGTTGLEGGWAGASCGGFRILIYSLRLFGLQSPGECGDVQGVAHQAVDDLSQKHSRELKKAKR
jgi:hypothetical protein